MALANPSNVKTLLREFLVSSSHLIESRSITIFIQDDLRGQTYVKDMDDTVSACAIAAIGTCAQRVPAVAEECLKTLIKLLSSKSRTCHSRLASVYLII